MKKGFLFAAALLTIASVAQAQISPIGTPFTGDRSENWDDPDPFGAYGGDFPGFYQSFTAFSHSATVTDTLYPGGQGMHITFSWGFGCSIFPRSAPKLCASAGGPAEWSFTPPVKAFGGYFGSNTPGGNKCEFQFFDESGASLGSEVVSDLDCTWRWAGWETTGALIAKVKLVGAQFQGGFIMMDDLELSYGDDPGCYPDCDGDGALTIDDFICFQTFFALGDPYADCDGDGALTIDDFICFQTFFAIGC